MKTPTRARVINRPMLSIVREKRYFSSQARLCESPRAVRRVAGMIKTRARVTPMSTRAAPLGEAIRAMSRVR